MTHKLFPNADRQIFHSRKFLKFDARVREFFFLCFVTILFISTTNRVEINANRVNRFTANMRLMSIESSKAISIQSCADIHAHVFREEKT